GLHGARRGGRRGRPPRGRGGIQGSRSRAAPGVLPKRRDARRRLDERRPVTTTRPPEPWPAPRGPTPHLPTLGGEGRGRPPATRVERNGERRTRVRPGSDFVR